MKKILDIITFILTKNDFKELNIDTGLLDNAKQQIAVVNKNIHDCFMNTTINQLMIIQYYFNSLQLLSYFYAIRSSIATIQNICKKFNQNENSCVLKFINVKKTSFFISQQREIIEFVEKILKGLFSEHLETTITVELDTGSPELEIIINILAELDLNMLLSELFELIFKSEVIKAARSAIIIYALLINSRKEETKVPSEKDIENRIMKIDKEYKNLSEKFKIFAKRNKINKIDIQVSSIEEQTASNNDKNGRGIAGSRNPNQKEPSVPSKIDNGIDVHG